MQADDPMDLITAYVSTQTNSRRPGLRLVCQCGWGMVAVHTDQPVSLADVVGAAVSHLDDVPHASFPLDESSEKISECFEIAGTWEQPRFFPAPHPADTPPCPRPSPRDSGS